ncbi:YacL family protein [Paraglaciecola aquimarina]|uniref:YacL family protein n=1 Tax=Paraglaciecola algarum TaxID=3050085 RepID=A0ABS9D628_9ALTE|nr:YacL family protein [Paraglaciecola sp. G1-23]MCF2948388.1 YacL family protein [Paraglaciecola sp. G1-23]
MEFQFRKGITGLPLAKCDLECEAFGDWLSHDLGTDRAKIKDLLEIVEQLLNKRLAHYELSGKEYYLTFEDDEVLLSLNNNQTTVDEFAEDYDPDESTGCGLIDFKHLLEQWAIFTRGG